MPGPLAAAIIAMKVAKIASNALGTKPTETPNVKMPRKKQKFKTENDTPPPTIDTPAPSAENSKLKVRKKSKLHGITLPKYQT